jgi:elongation factor 3
MATNSNPPIVVSKDTPPPPSPADVAALIDKAFNATTSAASIAASYAVCEVLLSTVGPHGLLQYGVLDLIRKAANDKKSGLKREGAQNVCRLVTIATNHAAGTLFVWR